MRPRYILIIIPIMKRKLYNYRRQFRKLSGIIWKNESNCILCPVSFARINSWIISIHLDSCTFAIATCDIFKATWIKAIWHFQSDMNHASVRRTDSKFHIQIDEKLSSHYTPICSHRSNICCPRDCVSRHNDGTSGAPLKPLRVDSALI